MDLIDRQVAIDALDNYMNKCTELYYLPTSGSIKRLISVLPSAQPGPSEITDEQAILHLQSTGWMQNHDREMYESGLREQLADDSGGYDSLIPCEDTISRQAAIEHCKKRLYETALNNMNDDSDLYQEIADNRIETWLDELPSAQPERLTDDDFETIRIHLSAYKEQLGNQHRWEEAEEYQRIIDRFMSFASAQPEIIYCKDCKWKNRHNCTRAVEVCIDDDKYCAWAERRTDE